MDTYISDASNMEADGIVADGIESDGIVADEIVTDEIGADGIVADGVEADGIEEDDNALTSLQTLRINEIRASCSRCKQGFCATHGTKLVAYKDPAPWAAITQLPDEEEAQGPEDEEFDVDTNPKSTKEERVPRKCKNEGCGKLFTEDENHSTACHYHRGPYTFAKRSTDDHKVQH